MKGVRQPQAAAPYTLAKELPVAVEQEAAWTSEPAWGFEEEINHLPFARLEPRFLGCPVVVKIEAKPATENVTRKCHVWTYVPQILFVYLQQKLLTKWNSNSFVLLHVSKLGFIYVNFWTPCLEGTIWLSLQHSCITRENVDKYSQPYPNSYSCPSFRGFQTREYSRTDVNKFQN